MGTMIKAKVRAIGTSAGILIPQEQLKEAKIAIGDEIMITIIPKRRAHAGFGIAKDFTIPFTRDKKTREFK